MSEYTNYFVVKSNSENDVKKKLNNAKINSIISVDTKDYCFTKNYKRNGKYNWIVVTAPPESGVDENGDFFFQDQFDNFETLFDTFILYHQDENFSDWSLKLKLEDTIIEKNFNTGTEIIFSDKERDLFTKCFDKEFTEIKEMLAKGSGIFLNYVGIPYMEMNDQNIVRLEKFENNYSVLDSELEY
jgi:hypothetical protein